MNRRIFLRSTSSTVAVTISGVLGHALESPAGPEQRQTAAREELVTAYTEDKLTLSGMVFSPVPQPAKPTAVVWVHGATANFYYPSYVAIARKMASDGHTFILGNTRMHDIGCVLAENADGSVLRRSANRTALLLLGGGAQGRRNQRMLRTSCLRLCRVNL